MRIIIIIIIILSRRREKEVVDEDSVHGWIVSDSSFQLDVPLTTKRLTMEEGSGPFVNLGQGTSQANNIFWSGESCVLFHNKLLWCTDFVKGVYEKWYQSFHTLPSCATKKIRVTFSSWNSKNISQKTSMQQPQTTDNNRMLHVSNKT